MFISHITSLVIFIVKCEYVKNKIGDSMADEITGLQCDGGTGDIKLLTEEHDSIERIKLIDEIWDEVKGMTQEMVKHNEFMETMITNMALQNQSLIDSISTVITGRKIADLELGNEGGESGVYDSTLNGRIQKTTEMITGILVGLFTEDEIKSKLEALDINKFSSIVENLGPMDSNASFMKNDLRRSSDFSNANGNEHNPSDPLIEITRAIKSLVVQHAWQGIKADKMSATLGVKQDGTTTSQEFYNEAKAANRKIAEDTVNQILNKDSNPTDDGNYVGNEGYK
jgi:hypothetical protein